MIDASVITLVQSCEKGRAQGVLIGRGPAFIPILQVDGAKRGVLCTGEVQELRTAG